MDVLETLKGGLEKVKEGWTKDYLARAKDGTPLGPHALNAVEWCIGGAFIVTAGWGTTSDEAMVACAEQLPEGSHPVEPNTWREPWDRMVAFNNSQESVEPIIEIIEKAIKAKEAEPVPA